MSAQQEYGSTLAERYMFNNGCQHYVPLPPCLRGGQRIQPGNDVHVFVQTDLQPSDRVVCRKQECKNARTRECENARMRECENARKKNTQVSQPFETIKREAIATQERQEHPRTTRTTKTPKTPRVDHTNITGTYCPSHCVVCCR